MRDSEEYPRHQSGKGKREGDHVDPFASQDQAEGELEDQPRRQGPIHQREVATTPQLPPGHARKALLVGLIAGLLYEGERVILTLANANIYREGARYTLNTMPASLAATITGIGALGYLIGIVVFFVGGLIIGKISVRRRWAFIGGFIGGVLCALIGSILQQISAYPNAGHTGFSGGFVGVSSGLLVLLIFSLFLCAITGVITLFGGWLMTRHNPYYVGYEE
jgi:hypothetical protein